MKFLKNNWLVIIFIFMGLLLSFKIYYETNKLIDGEKAGIELIRNRCQEIKDDIETNQDYAYCKNYINNKEVQLKSTNFYRKFHQVGYLDNLYYISFFASLIIYIISIYNVNNIFKSRIALLYLKREKYIKFLKHLFKKMYRYLWFWPLIIIFIFIACSINSSFDSNSTIAFANSIYTWNKELLNNPFVFLSLYLLNIIFHSILYINISLITVRYQHNYLLAVLESFLITIALDLFLEIIVGIVLLQNILHIKDYLVFNIFNLFSFNTYSSSLGALGILLFSFSMALLSFIIVLLCYRNKEKLVISCEKNN